MRLFLCSRVAISKRLAYLIHYFYSMESSINREELFQFGNLEILARSVVEGFITGLHKSPFHGFSVEFAEHKLYVPGDSIKNIDWKLFARTEKLFLKEYEDETNRATQSRRCFRRYNWYHFDRMHLNSNRADIWRRFRCSSQTDGTDIQLPFDNLHREFEAESLSGIRTPLSTL